MEFSRQGYQSGLSFPSPGDLPNPGIEPRSPALQADSLLTEPAGKTIEIEVELTIDVLHLNHPEAFPQPLSIKKLSSTITAEVKEGTSSVVSCPRLLAYGDAQAGVSQEIEPPLHWVLNRPPVALEIIGEICLFLSFLTSLWDRLKT